MRTLIVAALLILCSAISAAAQGTCPAGTPNAGLADCWFVAANGSDANNGTSESTPFLHAPGMSTATGNAAAVTMGAGKAIITRGGDVYHFGNSALSPFAGYTSRAWTIGANGTLTNCNRNPAAGTLTNTSCIYIGVDHAWFNSANCGSSWCPVVLDGDNPISTTPPAGGCAFQDGFDQTVHDSYVWLTVGNYSIFDGFEIRGYCWDGITATGNPQISAEAVVTIGTGSEAVNDYWHGWSEGPIATSAACQTNLQCDLDEYWAINSPNTISAYSRIDHCVFDGSDSTFGNLFGAYHDASGGMIRGGGEVDHNAFVHVSNVVKDTAVTSFHDNYGDALYEPWPGGSHGNWYEMFTTSWTQDTYYYNNLVLRAVIGETSDLYAGLASSSKHGFVFNNVMANPDGFAGSNCYLLESNSGTPGPIIDFNNTNVSQCTMESGHGGANTATHQNNHLINYSPATIAKFSSTGMTNTDNGNEKFATTAVANSQGYTVGGNWAPTSATCNGISSNCTVGTGANLTSICNSMDNATAKAACGAGTPTFSYNATTHVLTITPGATRGSSWDAGAWQFVTGGTIATPTLSPPGGTFSSTQNVTLSDSAAGATICFTTDGSTPTANGAGTCTHGSTYSATIAVATSLTIKAIASESGYTDSAVGSASFIIITVLPNPGAAGAFMGAL
jgi:hypothetical protein